MGIVRSEIPVTLLGGADHTPEVLDVALSFAPCLVAADGGADAALAAGLRPAAVIGDMDSISPAAATAFADRMHPIAEQDSTDFDKAWRSVEAPLVLAVGFSGGRLDHELAVISALLARPERPCIVVGAVSILFLCPPDLAIDLAPGTLVSLYPMAPCRIASDGLRWPTDGIDFSPQGRIGTSNEALGPVRLRPSDPVALAILPRQSLGVVVEALGAAVGAGAWGGREVGMPPKG